MRYDGFLYRPRLLELMTRLGFGRWAMGFTTQRQTYTVHRRRFISVMSTRTCRLVYKRTGPEINEDDISFLFSFVFASWYHFFSNDLLPTGASHAGNAMQRQSCGTSISFFH